MDIDTQGYIAVGNNRILAAFRGSEIAWPDWLTNMQAVRDPGPWKNTKVHEGFQDAFLASALLIGKVIGEIAKSKEIWITGHSLGGALAVLLAATLLENRVGVAGLYTFAGPRVGNNAFAHERSEGDLVPHVPPELFFCHARNRKRQMDGGVKWADKKWERL